MEDFIFELLANNQVYFCEKIGDCSTSSPHIMMNCFDVFVVDEGWFFYRLKDDCVKRGYLDKDECLIGPCEDYDKMICMAKVTDIIDSSLWIEDEQFNLNKNRNTLKQLIDEICKINQDAKNIEGDLDSYDNNDNNNLDNNNLDNNNLDNNNLDNNNLDNNNSDSDIDSMEDYEIKN